MERIVLTDDYRTDEPLAYLVPRHNQTMQEYDVTAHLTEARRLAERNELAQLEDEDEESAGDCYIYPLWAGYGVELSSADDENVFAKPNDDCSVAMEHAALQSLVREWRDATNDSLYQVLGGNRQSKADARDRLIAAEAALRAAVPN